MTDQYDACLTAYKAQLLAIAGDFFPASVGRAEGWQISENDTTPMEGGDYFITLKPGSFTNNRQGDVEDNSWNIITVLYMRYKEYNNLWPLFSAFRSAVIDLPKTSPLKTNGIRGQSFAAREDAGYLVDSQGNYTNFVVQALNCTILQRVLVRRAF